MRYAFLSDVHANLEALEVVVDFLVEQRPDKTFFLGDAVGYGPNPNEVCNILREVAQISVLGNHDAAVCGRMPTDGYHASARAAFDYSRQQLSAANMAWLRGLPYKVRDEALEVCHGSPLSPTDFDYLYRTEQVIDLVQQYEHLANLTFVGHSHLTISFRVADDEVAPILAPQIVCDEAAKHIITVGSVGQPRDRDPRACCGLYDVSTRHFVFHRFNYDVHTTQQKILQARLAGGFGERLFLGV